MQGTLEFISEMGQHKDHSNHLWTNLVRWFQSNRLSDDICCKIKSNLSAKITNVTH